MLKRTIGAVTAFLIVGAPQQAKAVTKDPSGLKMSSALSPDLDVAKSSKGPVTTLVDEFYKVGPGPSSLHTIGSMRIIYDFYQRCSKLPADRTRGAVHQRRSKGSRPHGRHGGCSRSVQKRRLGPRRSHPRPTRFLMCLCLPDTQSQP
jgi:hypothetical protein